MTLFLVSSLALLSGFSLALFVGAICLAVVAVDLKNKQKEGIEKYVKTLELELSAQRSLRIMAETEASGLKKSIEMQSKAIEANSLPWFPKTDKLEARYENEAVDKMENPSYYSDMVDGLGGLR